MKRCLKVISWKYSFQRINEEYALATKKKEALERLFKAGKISQPTYEWFSKEIDETLNDIEKHRKELMDKMNTKISELEQQIKTLEIFLVNLEIQRATGEVSGEIYKKQIESLTTGIDAAKQELDSLRSALDELALKPEATIEELPKLLEETTPSIAESTTTELEEKEEERTLEQFPISEEPDTLLEPVSTEEAVEKEPIETSQIADAEEKSSEPSISEEEIPL